jgi:hypothetical protein
MPCEFTFKILIMDDLESCWSGISWAFDVLVNRCVSVHVAYVVLLGTDIDCCDENCVERVWKVD